MSPYEMNPFSVFYTECISKFPRQMYNDDGSTGFWLFLAAGSMNLIVILWFALTVYTIALFPRRYMWLLPECERMRVCQELVNTVPDKRNEKLLDMCSHWAGSKDFCTDELFAHVNSKFQVMEDAGMIGPDGNILYELNWGFLEDDILIADLLEGGRKSARLRKNFLVKEFWDILGRAPSIFVACTRRYPSIKKSIEQWKMARIGRENADEEKGEVLIDVE
ncbi:hypothetical protein ONS95_010124 [Cadophora gregata]|uniref:uncharacterized protein n=1 Tax=Cadophora gregata TaxID=51156 RepID=UPI0026DAECAB|nr:uncharacterized protein ONS95_010124 [Cadophora gregata]KAK0121844.1 hypothetical protein ONS95_010124 [Cadophora gregata]